VGKWEPQDTGQAEEARALLRSLADLASGRPLSATRGAALCDAGVIWALWQNPEPYVTEVLSAARRFVARDLALPRHYAEQFRFPAESVLIAALVRNLPRIPINEKALQVCQWIDSSLPDRSENGAAFGYFVLLRQTRSLYQHQDTSPEARAFLERLWHRSIYCWVATVDLHYVDPENRADTLWEDPFPEELLPLLWHDAVIARCMQHALLSLPETPEAYVALAELLRAIQRAYTEHSNVEAVEFLLGLYDLYAGTRRQPLADLQIGSQAWTPEGGAAAQSRAVAESSPFGTFPWFGLSQAYTLRQSALREERRQGDDYFSFFRPYAELWADFRRQEQLGSAEGLDRKYSALDDEFLRAVRLAALYASDTEASGLKIKSSTLGLQEEGRSEQVSEAEGEDGP